MFFFPVSSSWILNLLITVFSVWVLVKILRGPKQKKSSHREQMEIERKNKEFWKEMDEFWEGELKWMKENGYRWNEKTQHMERIKDNSPLNK